MAFRTNAEGPEQEGAATRYAAHIGPRANDANYSAVFSVDGVLVIEAGEKYQFDSEQEFYRWVDAACPRDADGPIELLPLEEAGDQNVPESVTAEPVAAAEAPAEQIELGSADDDAGTGSEAAPRATGAISEATPVTPEADDEEPEGAGDPHPRAERALESGNLRDAFHDLVRDSFEVLRQEHAGEIGRNVARLRKGQIMTVVERFKERAKAEELEGLTTTKEILGALNSGLIAFANSHGIVDRFNRITENEATITRMVFERFTGQDGINARFRLLDAVDEATGRPLLNDAGEPIEVPISEVAVNNLYPLAEYATDLNRDKLASFAQRFSEKVVKGAKKLSKDRDIPILDVVEDINSLRRTVVSPVTEDEVAIQADEGSALSWIREQRGEEPPSEIINITTTRDWYESEYVPLKAIATQLYLTFGLPLNDSGEISNVKLLERIIGQYFSVHEYGPQRLIAAFVDAEDITTAKAERFLTRWRWDAERGEMVEQEVSEEEAQALVDAVATGDTPAEPEEEFGDAFGEELELDLDVATPAAAAVAVEEGEDWDDDADDF